MFVITADYESMPDDRDGRLEKAARRTADGGGYGLGRRDLSWALKTFAPARRLLLRIVDAKIPGVRVGFYEED